MTEPQRLDTLAAALTRIRGRVCWLARAVTRVAVVGGIAGAVLWWRLLGDDLDEWWSGTAKAVIVLAVLLAPALWLLNVRFALTSLVELPDRLGGIARRRGTQLRALPAERPANGTVEVVRNVRDVVQDYGEVTGSWALVGQLLAPTFWLFTAAAVGLVPVLVIAALIASVVS